MHAHIRPVVFEVRIYESDEGGYDRAEPYVAACNATVTVNGDGEYFISMMSGKFGHQQMTAVLKAAKQWGAKRLWFKRGQKLHSLVVR